MKSGCKYGASWGSKTKFKKKNRRLYFITVRKERIGTTVNTIRQRFTFGIIL